MGVIISIQPTKKIQMKKILATLFIFIFITRITFAQQTTNPVIYLWPGGAPGFESKKDIPEEAKDW